MALKLNRSIIFLFFSFFFFAMNQIDRSEGSSKSVLSCLERILPCQYYIHYSNPPASCCSRLKEMLGFDPMCVCAVFKNHNILHALNATSQDAANMTASCGVEANFDLCDVSSTRSITLGENFRNANGFIMVSISVLIVIGIM